MFPLSHILCISLSLPAKMFTKYGALLIPEHLASKQHVHQEGARVPRQIMFLPPQDAAPRPNNSQTAKAEERETARHTDFVMTPPNSPEQKPSAAVSPGWV